MYVTVCRSADSELIVVLTSAAVYDQPLVVICKACTTSSS